MWTFAFYWFHLSPSHFLESLRWLQVTAHPSRKKTKKKFLPNTQIKVNLICHVRWEKALLRLGPCTSAKTHYTTWWIINKIKMNLRSTLKHPHFILHTTQAHFKQTPQQWFRQRKPLPVGELCVFEVPPQRPLCFQHPYIRSQGRATKALPNISFSQSFLCSLTCRYGTCSTSFKTKKRRECLGWDVKRN